MIAPQNGALGVSDSLMEKQGSGGEARWIFLPLASPCCTLFRSPTDWVAGQKRGC